jgi:hypothetical protein
MNIFKRWRERREQRRKLKEWSRLAGAMGTLDVMEEKGLLAWNAQNRQMLIESSLAMVMMTTVEKWTAFIRGLYVWSQNKRIWEAWEDFRVKEELKAVREVSNKLPKGKKLSRQDIDRIREARRMELTESDVEPPKVEGYEFVIVSPSLEVNPDMKPSDPVGNIVAVGHYDPETERLEMATWEEVSHLVHEVKSEK